MKPITIKNIVNKQFTNGFSPMLNASIIEAPTKGISFAFKVGDLGFARHTLSDVKGISEDSAILALWTGEQTCLVSNSLVLQSKKSKVKETVYFGRALTTMLLTLPPKYEVRIYGDSPFYFQAKIMELGVTLEQTYYENFVSRDIEFFQNIKYCINSYMMFSDEKLYVDMDFCNTKHEKYYYFRGNENETLLQVSEANAKSEEVLVKVSNAAIKNKIVFMKAPFDVIKKYVKGQAEFYQSKNHQIFYGFDTDAFSGGIINNASIQLPIE